MYYLMEDGASHLIIKKSVSGTFEELFTQPFIEKYIPKLDTYIVINLN